MPLSPGTRVGQYEVRELIGKGGMGEVYRAHDLKLKRDVAIKLLPEQFALDPERLARFRREAQLLASLNHPNIATIYGLEDANGSHFLVMELVPGETLAEIIHQSPDRERGADLGRANPSRAREQAVGLPLEESLDIAKQICEALEAAHEKSVIHRDLKPANVKLTPEGKVKVLDFGLAKAFSADSSSEIPLDSNSPTVAPGASPTIPGAILGTAAYMSPEQARGKVVDKRADIWALGCVLYELLTGVNPFQSRDSDGAVTVQDILGAVLHKEPDWSLLPALTPPGIRALLRRCLQKDASKRLRSAADVAIAIDDSLTAAGSAQPVAVAPPKSSWKRRLAFSAVGLAGLATAAFVGMKIDAPSPPPEPKTVSRFAITLPTGDRLQTGANGPVLDLSEDGRRVVYVALHGGVQQPFVRGIDSMEAQPIRGTEGALSPFFSPDGQSVGFIVPAQMMKIAVSGGTPQNLTNVINDVGGASWGPNDTIVLSRAAAEPLRTVPSNGGTPSPLTILKGQISHRWPQLLPGGKAVLFTGFISGGDTSQILVERTDTHERKVVVQGGTYPRYVPTGHLLFVRAATLMAVPFDLNRLEVKGQPVPVVEGVMQTAQGGWTVQRF